MHENIQLSTYRISLINPPATPIKIQKIEQKLFWVKQKFEKKNLEKKKISWWTLSKYFPNLNL